LNETGQSAVDGKHFFACIRSYETVSTGLLRFNNDWIAAAIAKVEIYAGMTGCSIETGTDSVQSAVKYQSRQQLSHFFIIGIKIGKIRSK